MDRHDECDKCKTVVAKYNSEKLKVEEFERVCQLLEDRKWHI
jgi:hypothetical protein